MTKVILSFALTVALIPGLRFNFELKEFHLILLAVHAEKSEYLPVSHRL